MSKKFVYPLILVFILMGVFGLAIRVQRAEAYGTIYIRADGSVEGTTYIVSSDNVTYVLTADINDSVVVQRNNTIINGNGYTLNGSGFVDVYGFNLTSVSNVTIQNTNIRGFNVGVYFNLTYGNRFSGNKITSKEYGIYLVESSNNNTITGNNVTGNGYGIALDTSSNNTITGNNITGNNYGIAFYSSSNNTITGNNMIANNHLCILLSTSSTNTVNGNNITGNEYGIALDTSSNNTINGNNITNRIHGIYLLFSSNNNTITENNIIDNGSGVAFNSSSKNRFYHNNFVNNAKHVDIDSSSVNAWNDEIEGNYWSNYTEADLDHDGIGGSTHDINADNKDSYPLMGMFHSFSSSLGYHVNVISNSTIEDFQYFESNSTIKMHVSNMTANQTFGFCRVSIPHALMDNPDIIRVLIDDGETELLFANLTLYDNGINRWIYFAYEHSSHEIIIQEDTAPPIISVISPENKTYSMNTLPLTFNVDESTYWIGYSLKGQTNVTITGNTTLYDLSDGSHYIVVYANDTFGNMGASNTVYFTVDTAAPSIIILSPENETYNMNDIPLNFTLSEPTSWIGYGFDGLANVTITGNTTLSGLSEASHWVKIYANDTVGNMGASNTVYFTIDTTPPNITDVSQFPLPSNVLPEDEVDVNATVGDQISGVKQVTLNYTNGNGTWITISMTNLEGNIWKATIPAFPYGTNVTYTIIAEDNAGNTVSSETQGYECQYQVIPEFPSFLILPMFMISTLLAIIVYKRKQSTTGRRQSYIRRKNNT